ncbi:MAG: hypothetical protein EPO00_03370, partial [Chloroflexota bacterium]
MSPKPRPDRPERREDRAWRPKGRGPGHMPAAGPRPRGPGGHAGSPRPPGDRSPDRRPPDGPRVDTGGAARGPTGHGGPRIPVRPNRPSGPPRPADRFEGRPPWAAGDLGRPGTGPADDGPRHDRDRGTLGAHGSSGDRIDRAGPRGADRPRGPRRDGRPTGPDRGRYERPGQGTPSGRSWNQPRPYAASPVPTAERLGPDEELVAGRRPVEEAFAARRPARRLLVTPQRRLALERIVLHATTLRIPIVEVEGGTLTSLTGFDGHQGVALVVAQRVFAAPADLLARAIERGEPAFVLVLDSLEDPQNLGAAEQRPEVDR